jgi:Holliday junction resolvase RusA-like endonuclease
MKAITFSVAGKPVPQPRQRTTKSGHTYYPDNGIREYRDAIAAAAKAAGATPTDELPLTMIVDWVFQRPKSHFRKDGTLRPGVPMLPRGDNKNLLSGVEDALNGIAYMDDHQIGKHVLDRSYGNEARTTVRVQ